MTTRALATAVDAVAATALVAARVATAARLADWSKGRTAVAQVENGLRYGDEKNKHWNVKRKNNSKTCLLDAHVVLRCDLDNISRGGTFLS